MSDLTDISSSLVGFFGEAPTASAFLDGGDVMVAGVATLPVCGCVSCDPVLPMLGGETYSKTTL